MTIKKAIEKAIKGGYRGKILDYFLKHNNEVIDTTNCDVLGTLLIDPLFWQSLGKAMGWENESECPLACCGGICPIDIPMWQSQWHLFIDKLANGGTAEQFFNQKMSFSG